MLMEKRRFFLTSIICKLFLAVFLTHLLSYRFSLPTDHSG